jgi:putative DNA primase/helicase
MNLSSEELARHGLARASGPVIHASFGGYQPPNQLQRARFNLTDAGNSLRFTQDHVDNLMYVEGPGWHIWDERRWRKDESAAWRAAKESARRIRHEAAAIQDKELSKKVWAWAHQSESRGKLDAMRRLAEKGETHGDSLRVAMAELEKHPNLLNCANGTVDLRNGRLLKHNKKHYLTHLVDIEYAPKKRSPRWERFVREVFSDDDELVAYVQRAVGYCATAENTEKCFFIATGTGDNGKTVFRETITSVLGEFARAALAGTFVTSKFSRGSTDYDLARLVSARLVSVAETARGDRLAIQTLKEISGRDTIAAREPYGKPFDYKPTFKIWITTNTLPSLPFNEEATWKRVRVIPFMREVTDAQKDPALADKLANERQGILTWIAEGARNWYRGGLGELPLAVEVATYSYQTSQDTIARFLEEETEDSEHVLTPATELAIAYSEFCRAEGLQPMGRNHFYAALRNQGYRRSKNASSTRCFVGLRMRG